MTLKLKRLKRNPVKPQSLDPKKRQQTQEDIVSIPTVGKTVIREPGKHSRKLNYNDVYYGFDGWADASKFRPLEFELVSLQTDKGKILSGWSTGNHYDSLHFRPEYNIVAWKPMEAEKEPKKDSFFWD